MESKLIVARETSRVNVREKARRGGWKEKALYLRGRAEPLMSFTVLDKRIDAE